MVDQNQIPQTEQQLAQQPITNNTNPKNFRQIILYLVVFLLLIGGTAAYFIRDNQANLQKADDATKIKLLEEKVVVLEKTNNITEEPVIPLTDNLQVGQRDGQRKNDLTRFITAAINYASNNRGAFPSGLGDSPTSWNSMVVKYISTDGDVFSDPLGTGYIPTTTLDSLPSTFNPKNPVILITTGAICGSNGSIIINQNSREVALQMRLEVGDIYCVNN